MTDDRDISRHYRELPREEPPRHLDDAIRAAARRAVGTRPAPLVAPTSRQRWYFPLAAAAVIVLAVAVTLHVEREQPGEEVVTAPAATAEQPKLEQPRSVPQPERRRKTESADSRELRDAAPPPQLQKTTPEPTPALPPAPPPVAAQDAMRGARESAAGALASRADDGRREAPLSAFALQSPEQWLQGIADLRRQGRHEEADKSLAEFRKRYPDYRISKEVLQQLEKR
jgi:hypothetical protein